MQAASSVTFFQEYFLHHVLYYHSMPRKPLIDEIGTSYGHITLEILGFDSNMMKMIKKK